MTITPEALQDQITKRLSYNPETGAISWLRSPRSDWVGKTAGTKVFGYIKIRIGRRNHFAHRVAWLLHYGQWPEQEIDHIDGNGLDNRIANLRLCSRSQNMANARRRVDNACGFKGVTFKPNHRLKFQARISSEGKQKTIGSFATAEEAHAAYCNAAAQKSGEFANAG